MPPAPLATQQTFRWWRRRWPAAGPRDLLKDAWEDYASVYAWFLGLQLVDLLTTFAVLHMGGLEGNPTAAAVLAKTGAYGLVVFKVILIALTAFVWIPAVFWLAQRPVDRDGWALVTLNGLVLCGAVYYCIIVLHNLANLAVLIGGR